MTHPPATQNISLVYYYLIKLYTYSRIILASVIGAFNLVLCLCWIWFTIMVIQFYTTVAHQKLRGSELHKIGVMKCWIWADIPQSEMAESQNFGGLLLDADLFLSEWENRLEIPQEKAFCKIPRIAWFWSAQKYNKSQSCWGQVFALPTQANISYCTGVQNI